MLVFCPRERQTWSLQRIRVGCCREAVRGLFLDLRGDGTADIRDRRMRHSTS